MQEYIEPPDELMPSSPVEEQPLLEAPLQANGVLPPSPAITPSGNQAFFDTQDDEVSEDDSGGGLSSPLVMPFQPSTPLPTMRPPAPPVWAGGRGGVGTGLEHAQSAVCQAPDPVFARPA